MTAVSLPYSLKLKASSGGNGTGSVEFKGEGGKPGMAVSCGTIISCTYSASTINLAFSGGSGSASLQASSVALTGTGSKCGTGATLNGKFILSSPTSVFLTDPGKTKLCKANEIPCSTGVSIYPSGTVLRGATAAGSPALLKIPSLGEVECASSMQMMTTAESGEPLPAEVTALGWSGCKVVGKEQTCTVETVSLPFGATVSATEGGGGGGTIVVKAGAEGGEPGATVVCGTIVNCTYSNASSTLAYTGGAAGTANMTATAVPLTGTGVKCGSGATWTAKYVLSEPSPIFATTPVPPPPGTKLCKVNEPICAAGNTYPSGTVFKWGTVASGFEITTKAAGTLKCTSTISGATTASSGEPLPGTMTAFTFSGCKLGSLECTMTSIDLPYNTTTNRTGENVGTFSISSGGSGNAGWTVVAEP